MSEKLTFCIDLSDNRHDEFTYVWAVWIKGENRIRYPDCLTSRASCGSAMSKWGAKWAVRRAIRRIRRQILHPETTRYEVTR